MRKLEDIPKKNIHQVPDDYFDKLPGMIQARVSREKPEARAAFGLALRYALPVVVIAVAAILWFGGDKTPKDAETILASIQTEELIEYLADSDMALEDMLNAANFTSEDVAAIEGEVYDVQLDDATLDDLLDDFGYELKD